MLHLFFLVYLSCFLSLIAYSQGRTRFDGCPNVEGIFTHCMVDPNNPGCKDCPEGYKCCPYGCGSACLAVTKSSKYPGSCPAKLTRSGYACKNDAVCKANEKCCNGRCEVVRPYTVPVIG